MAEHANKQRHAHELQELNDDDCWLLLQYQVLGKPRCPPKLESHGKKIIKLCGGLPLAVVFIGGILLNKRSNDMNANEREWDNVQECAHLLCD